MGLGGFGDMPPAGRGDESQLFRDARFLGLRSALQIRARSGPVLTRGRGGSGRKRLIRTRCEARRGGLDAWAWEGRGWRVRPAGP